MVTPRNELKYLISSASARLLESRLGAVLQKDRHTAAFGGYEIRSLYFDDPASSAFFDKVNGIEKRAKYRIRFYNQSLDFIRLEKKEKRGNLSVKSGLQISEKDASVILSSPEDIECADTLFSKLRDKRIHEHFQPLLFVDYTRKAYLHPAGNVRITLDSRLFASPFRGDLLDRAGRVPALSPSETILEVKYDSFLPPYISAVLADIPKVQIAFSKFCKCHEILY